MVTESILQSSERVSESHMLLNVIEILRINIPYPRNQDK